jgi:hypothetical protein
MYCPSGVSDGYCIMTKPPASSLNQPARPESPSGLNKSTRRAVGTLPDSTFRSRVLSIRANKIRQALRWAGNTSSLANADVIRPDPGARSDRRRYVFRA